MPRTRTRKTPPAKDATIHVAVTSFWAGLEDGTAAFVRAGDRFRGDDEIVRRLAPYFVEDGGGGDARLRALTELAGSPPAPERVPEPPKMMRATRRVTGTSSVSSVGIRTEGSFVEPFEPAMFVVEPGDTLPSNHPLVGLHEDCFEEVVDD